MPQQSVSDIWNAFVQAGFSKKEASILTATSYYESTYNTTPSGGNGGGLLQFSQDTWKSTGVTCSITDLSCQAQAAYQLVQKHGGDNFFPTVWFTAWYMPEHLQSGVTSGGYDSIIGAIEHSLGVSTTAAQDVNSWVAQGSPSGPTVTGSTPVIGGIANPGGAIKSAVTSVVGGALNNIGQGIAGAAGAIGKAILPWLIILGIGFFALVMLGRELGSHSGTTVITQAPANRGPSAGRAGGAGTAAEAAEVAA